ncbi:MAG: 5-bromo-4-chloroindolyl phosphate hydrolysis family protein [Spirochaetales bacterium]
MKHKGLAEYAGIVAGGVGGMAFGVTLLLAGSFFWAAGVSLLVFLGTWVVLSPKPSNEERVGRNQLYQEILKLGKQQVQEMAHWISQIRNPQVRLQAEKILTLARKIIIEVERDPKDISLAKSFLNYHFRAVGNILRQYVELTERTPEGSRLQETVKRVEHRLQDIAEVFEKQYEKLLANDVLELDVELKVLEQSIEGEKNERT